MPVSNYETEFIAKLEQIIVSSGGSVPPMTGPTNFQLRSLELLDAINVAAGGSATALQKANNLSDLANVATARGNLGATNSPTFSVTKSTSQSLAHSISTQVTWDVEEFDSGNAFASNAFTVPTGLGGVYLLGLSMSPVDSSDLTRMLIALYKNGSEVARIFDSAASGVGLSLTANGIAILSLASGDVVTAYITVTTTSTNPASTKAVAPASRLNRFWGLRLIA